MKARAADTFPDTPRNRREIAERWAKGHDTLRIAKSIALTEPEVCRILAHLQDERHAARQQEGAGV
ncbi:Homeodomain-like domain-containing protein [Methylorubrum aminovorans]